MTDINLAYEVLGDPQKRAEYDKGHAARANSSPTSRVRSSAFDYVYKPAYEKLKRELLSVKKDLLSEILRDFAWTDARRPVSKTKIARMVAKIPEVVTGIGALLALVGLLLTARYVPVFTIMLLIGASGLGVGLYELRRRKSKRNRMRPRHIWALIAVSGLFLVTGLTKRAGVLFRSNHCDVGRRRIYGSGTDSKAHAGRSVGSFHSTIRNPDSRCSGAFFWPPAWQPPDHGPIRRCPSPGLYRTSLRRSSGARRWPLPIAPR